MNFWIIYIQITIKLNNLIIYGNKNESERNGVSDNDYCSYNE